MWAQLIKGRVRAGKEDEMRALQSEVARRAREDSTGWARSITLQNQSDPQEYYSLVFFDSEEKARENEGRPEHQELTQKFRQVFDGPPEFVNLNPVHEESR